MFRYEELAEKSQQLKRKSPIERLPIVSVYKQDPLSKKIQMLDDLDYESKSYPSALGVNITTNESGSGKIIQQLTESKASRNSCHIGVSGWFNLDIIAARRTSRGIIFDSNPYVSLFFDHTFNHILDCSDRQTFIARMQTCVSDYDKDQKLDTSNLSKYSFSISPNILFEDAPYPQEEIERHAQTSGSWLETDSSYAFIRSLVLHQKIVVITQDITHHEVFQKIRRLLNDNGISIDTLYLSNVHDYIYSLGNKQDFLKTFGLLSEDATWLIDSFAKVMYLEQCITACSELNAQDKQLQHWFPGVSFPIPLEKPSITKDVALVPTVKEPQSSLKLTMAWSMVTVMLILNLATQLEESESKPQFKL